MNMTGDPTQQNNPNLFGVNYNFPTTSNQVDWTKYSNQPAMSVPPQFNNSVNFGAAFAPPGHMSFSMNFPTQTPVQPVNFSPPKTPLANYCFGAEENRPQAPVQFPFPITSDGSNNTAGGGFGNKPLHVPLRCKRKTDSPP